jgi:hypothetical protein
MTLRALLLIAMMVVTSAHGESTWQWLKRTGNCNTGSCQGGHGGLAYMNWGDDAPPVYNNIELAPDAPFATEHPFQQPAPGQRFYDDRCEELIHTHASDDGWCWSRLYRRGVHIGYILWRPPVPLVTI